MTKQEALKIINQVGEDFAWQMGKVGANYENGYMQAIRDCKSALNKSVQKVETNADRIRNMSDEELEEFINYPCKFIKTEKNACTFYCDECIPKWLKEKVE